MELEGAVALVTGGGRGIGRAIALELARRGADLGIADIDSVTAQAVAGEIRSLGRRAVPLKVDVAKKQQVEEMVRCALAELGRLDVMVNNAGVGHAKPFLEITEEEWDRVFSINVKGMLFGMQAAARVMIDRRIEGRIINMASVAGKGGRPLLAAYAASKAAVINLTQSTAYALAPHKIKVNCVCPGVVATPLGDAVLSRMQSYADTGSVPVEHARVPPAALGRDATPEEVALMVAYLAGKGGAPMTGQAINVDGGRCMH
jgi:acetoin reductase-like protein